MKTSILLTLLVGVAVAITDKDLQPYRRGKEYVYELNSQGLNGIPHLDTQFTGLKFSSKVTFQYGLQQRSSLTFNDTRFFMILRKLDELPIHEMVPKKDWAKVTPDAEAIYDECFKNPVSFRYEDGLVSDLQVEADEPEWCTNMKKGVLTLLQLNLKQENQLLDVDPILADVISRSRVSWDRTWDKSYRVMEDGVDGECESVYVFQGPHEHSVAPENDDQQVTKIRNYDNCRRTPAHENGPFSSYVAHQENPENGTGIRRFSHTNTTIRGDRDDFIIRGVKQVSSHFYTPAQEMNGEVAVFALQEMRLVSVKDQIGEMDQPRRPRQEESLRIKLREHYKKEQYNTEDPPTIPSISRTQQILRTIEVYVDRIHQAFWTDTMRHIESINFVLRQSSSDDIIHAINALPHPKSQQQTTDYHDDEATHHLNVMQFDVLLDMIPTIGRPQAVRVMQYLIEREYITPFKAAMAFNYFALTMVPTEETFRNMSLNSDLMALPMVHNNPQLRRSIALAAASNMHAFVMAQRSEPVDDTTYFNITYNFANEWQELYRQSKNMEDKDLAMKVIGNSGLVNFFELVIREVQTSSNPKYLRINAINALRRMPQELNQEIHNTLLPIYLNQSEEYSLRCVCYLFIMQGNPSYGTMQTIMTSLYREQSHQVGAFVYSHLQVVRDSTRLSLRQTRQYVRFAMKQAQPFTTRKSWMYHNSYSLDLLAEEMGIGQYLDMFFIDSETNIFPAGFSTRAGTTLHGREMRLMETGMHIKGAMEVLSRLVGPKSILEDLLADKQDLSSEFMEIVKELLSPTKKPRKEQVNKIIQNVITKLGLSEPKPDMFQYASYFKVLGNEMRYWFVEAEDIIDFIEHHKEEAYKWMLKWIEQWQKGKKINWQSTTYIDNSLVMPTQLGIPLNVNESYTQILRIIGNTQLKSNPLSAHKGDRNITFKTELLPQVGILARQGMGLSLPLLQTGVYMDYLVKYADNHNFSLNYNTDVQNLQVSYQIPNDESNILKVFFEPKSFVRVIIPFIALDVYYTEESGFKQTILTRPVQMTIPYHSEMFGTRLEHQLEFPTPIVSYVPMRPFMGKHNYILKRNHGPKAPQFVDFIIARQTPPEAEKKSKYSQDEEEQRQIRLSTSGERKANYRSSSRSEESLEQDIDMKKMKPVKKDQRLSDNTNIYGWTMQFKTRNTPKQYNFQSMVQLMADDKKRCQLNAQYSEELYNYQGQYNAYVNFEKILFPRINADREMVADCEFKWSNGGKDTKEYRTHLQIQTNDEQKDVKVPVEPYYIYKLRQFLSLPNVEMKYESAQDQEQSSRSSWLFGGSQSHGAEMYGDEQPKEYNERIEMALPELRKHAFKYTVHFNYKQVPQQWQQYIDDAFNRMCYTMAKCSANKQKQNPRPTGTVNIDARIVPSIERIQLYIDSPKYDTDIFYTARMPTYLKRSLTLDSDLIFVNTSQSPINEQKQYDRQCQIERDEEGKSIVKTYDELSFKLPKMGEECEVLVTKDCSDSHNFAILLAQSEDIKKVTIQLASRPSALQIRVTRDGYSELRVDGQQMPLRDGERKEISMIIKGRSVSAQISKKQDSIYIAINDLGFNVFASSQMIRIESNPLYSGKLCGVCGNYNGESLREMTGPTGKVYTQAEPFVLSYVLPSDRCDVEELRKQQDIDTDKQDTRCSALEERTMVVSDQKDDQGRDVTCLSIKPVRVCPKQCRPKETKKQREGFLCLPGDLTSTRLLLEEEDQSTSLSELGLETPNKELELNIPETCEPLY